MMSGWRPDRSGVTRAVEQGLPLLRTEALHAPVVGDADLFHDLAGLDLAHAGQRLEQRDDLELADVGVVGVERIARARSNPS